MSHAGGAYRVGCLRLVPAGCREVEEVSVEERAKAAALMGFLFESSALVRADFSDSEERKKELYRQRQDLRIKVKKWVVSTLFPAFRTCWQRVLLPSLY